MEEHETCVEAMLQQAKRQCHEHDAFIQKLLEKQAVYALRCERVFRSHEELASFFQAFKTWRTERRTTRSFKLEREALLFTAQSFYSLLFPQTDLVSELLQCIFQADGDFRILFLSKETTWPLFAEVGTSPESYTPLEYFMHHAYKNQMLFHGVRMAEVSVYDSSWKCPCELAIYSGSQGLLELLLRYGALLSPGSKSRSRCVNDITILVHPLLLLLRRCIRSLFTLNPDFLQLDKLEPDISRNFTEYVLSARLLLRICSYFQPEIIFSAWFGEPNRKKMYHYLERLEEYLPTFPRRCVRPMRLKHCCRLVIRQTLYNNFRLPLGLDSLYLPVTLKDYLNLQKD